VVEKMFKQSFTEIHSCISNRSATHLPFEVSTHYTLKTYNKNTSNNMKKKNKHSQLGHQTDSLPTA
jgi:hypothetical protein